MVIIVIYSLIISLGLSNAVVYELVFDWLRELWCEKLFKEDKYPKINYLIQCPVCIGFWIGILVGSIITLELIPTLVVGFGTSFINKLILIWQEK